jgi:hypothetical protein
MSRLDLNKIDLSRLSRAHQQLLRAAAKLSDKLRERAPYEACPLCVPRVVGTSALRRCYRFATTPSGLGRSQPVSPSSVFLV